MKFPATGRLKPVDLYLLRIQGAHLSQTHYCRTNKDYRKVSPKGNTPLLLSDMRTGLGSHRRLELFSEMQKSNMTLSAVMSAVADGHNGSHSPCLAPIPFFGPISVNQRYQQKYQHQLSLDTFDN